MFPAKRCGPSNGVMDADADAAEAANMPFPILLAAELDEVEVDAVGEKVALYAERGERRFRLGVALGGCACDLAEAEMEVEVEVVLPASEGGSGGRAAFLILGEKYADTAVVGVVRPELVPEFG